MSANPSNLAGEVMHYVSATITAAFGSPTFTQAATGNSRGANVAEGAKLTAKLTPAPANGLSVEHCIS